MKISVLATLCAVLATPVLAHDEADWIYRGSYKNAAGELCCGPNDCKIVPGSDVQITSAGYMIRSTKEVIPFHQAQPSPNSLYWRCAWPTPADRVCFFAPPGTQ